MGLINVFFRVHLTKLEDEILPAFHRSVEELSMAPLLPYLDVERVRADWGRDPTVELRTAGFFKKRTVVHFDPPAGTLLGAALISPDDKGLDVDKLLYHLRWQEALLSKEDWQRWDQLLEYGHNLPDVFQDQEGPYGLLSPKELPPFMELLQRAETRLGADVDGSRNRADLERLRGYLSGTAPSEGVLVYTG